VTLRGLFTNRSVRNLLAPAAPPGHTVFAPSGEVLPLWRAARRYADSGLPVVILAEERYGTGSSRDWAAKGVQLLGVRAVLAASIERIHRANLVCMGVAPLRLPAGWHPATLALRPGDTLEIALGASALAPRAAVPITLRRGDGSRLAGRATLLVETAHEAALLREGGMIPTILRRALAARTPTLSPRNDDGGSP
jgi:aconitate hydratase